MVASKIAGGRKNAMDSVKGVIASLILLFGFLPWTTRIQTADKDAFTADGAKPVIAAAVVKGRRVNAANSLAADTQEASSSFPATYFSSEKVAALYASGGELLGWKDGENKYRVRVSVGHKEQEFAMSHAFTHIYYIVEGSATFVIGGTIVDPKTVKPISPAPGKEIRGTSMEGGETHHVSKGDVLIVPRGVTHWWKEVQPGPFVYFVVQVS
jgi:mannose-6-phosphate isomerase-like protein (cupin superfamily)